MNFITFRRSRPRVALTVAMAATFGAAVQPAPAQNIYINEIFFNQPSQRNNPSGPPFTAPDSTHAYIELRGTPCLDLTNTFLVFLENEAMADPSAGDAGTIELIFDLNGYTLGTNGYLSIRQKQGANPQYNGYAVDPKATNLQNVGAGAGFGSGVDSSIGATSFNENSGGPTGEFEGSGFTALLIRTDGAESSKPVINVDLDADNAGGLDAPGGNAGWTILDSIGVFGEGGEEESGRTYAALNFGFIPPSLITWLQPGQEYVQLTWDGEESEYVGRWGNSTGSAATDWHVSNLTDRIPTSGFTNMGDFRQSADPHGSANPADWESSHGVLYGTAITTTIGAPNYPLNLLTPVAGDFDGDGAVNALDHDDQWRPRFNCDDLDGHDILAWQRNLGSLQLPPIPAGAASLAAPEPACGLLAAATLAAIAMAQARSRPRRRGQFA